MAETDCDRIALYDRERKGIFIHADLLRGTLFRPGDRFVARPAGRELFAVAIARDEDGDIFYGNQGIFVARTRRIDILMGGIFDKYVVFVSAANPDVIKLRPLDIVLDTEQKWH
jgi:hypothetical protein